jgi:hypothetical protein
MEMVPAFRRYLLHLPAVRSYVPDDWVFSDSLREHPDRTGKRAIVVRDHGGGWAQPEQSNTQEFPMLALDFWSDASRNAQGEMLAPDALVSARAMFRAIDPFLHGLRDMFIGGFGTNRGLRVVTSKRWSEPSHQTKAESHGGAQHGDGVTSYGVALGDCAVVTAKYALVVVH